jgi:O-antigen ligase
MTLSRSGWGALFFALPIAVLLLLSRRQRRKEGTYLAAFLLGVATFAVLGSLFLGLPVVKRLETFFDVYNSDSIKAHLSILRGSYELFRRQPIFGTGYGSFSEHFGESSEAAFYFSKDPVQGNRVPPHSVWGGLLAETGILGFSAFGALMVVILYKLFREFWRQGEDWPYHLGGFCSILGLLFSGIFYSYSLIFFWFYIFLTFGLATFSDDKD